MTPRVRPLDGSAVHSETTSVRSTAGAVTCAFGSMMNVHAPDDRWVALFFHAMLAAGFYLARRGMIALAIIGGKYGEGAQLPSVRAFAQQTHTNPLTFMPSVAGVGSAGTFGHSAEQMKREG